MSGSCRIRPAVLGSFHSARRPPGPSMLYGVRIPSLLMRNCLPAPSLTTTGSVTSQEGSLPLGEGASPRCRWRELSRTLCSPRRALADLLPHTALISSAQVSLRGAGPGDGGHRGDSCTLIRGGQGGWWRAKPPGQAPALRLRGPTPALAPCPPGAAPSPHGALGCLESFQTPIVTSHKPELLRAL